LLNKKSHPPKQTNPPPPPPPQYKKIIIWGCGSGSRSLTIRINLGILKYEILAYTDSNVKLQGTCFLGKQVIQPGRIGAYDFDKAIIMANDVRIVKDLLTYGIPIEKIDFSLYWDFEIITRARLIALRNSAQLINDLKIKGSVAELGVDKGNFAREINAFFPDRRLYLFDTFEGFSDKDLEMESAVVNDANFNWKGFNKSVEIVLNKMPNPRNCIIKKGYFPETASGLEDNFAFVSLDCDLYQPMLAGLKYFYPRMSRKGIIFVHDYLSPLFGDSVKRAVFEFMEIFDDASFVLLGDNMSIAITKP
jgi:O-methyltransferase